jgi:sulfate/thiosulfate transport system substrate-binding protein
MRCGKLGCFALVLVAGWLPGIGQMGAAAEPVKLLNVSYDPTRELYQSVNKAFAESWEKKTGQAVSIDQSHGGSGKQARSVIDGLEADVVTLALGYDIDSIAEIGKLLPKGWQKEFPHNSCPYTSTITFLVHKGNPKAIKDWDDLVKPGVQVITPNPKTSGGARWNYLAAWGYAQNKFKNDSAQIKAFMAALFKNVPVLDTGARGSTTTFVERGIGDVLITWENEAFLALKEYGAEKFESVVPSLSILAEPPVALVSANAEKHRTRDLARAYLEFLYTDAAQELIGEHFYRPVAAQAQAKFAARFPAVKMLTIDGDFGGWAKAQSAHFQDGGTFDQIYGAGN